MVRHEVADYSVHLIGDDQGLIGVVLETYVNRWVIRIERHCNFVLNVRDLLTKGRRKLAPCSVDANLDCEVLYSVIETPWDSATDRGTQHGHSTTVEIDNLIVFHREKGESTHTRLEVGRVYASKELLDELRTTLVEELEERHR